jgi:hypothetical protein
MGKMIAALQWQLMFWRKWGIVCLGIGADNRPSLAFGSICAALLGFFRYFRLEFDVLVFFLNLAML